MIGSSAALRALLVSSVSALALVAATPAAAQSPLMRGRMGAADPAQAAARAATGLQRDQLRAQAAAQQSLIGLQRAAQATAAMATLQASARAAALAAPNPGVPNGLVVGGLVPRPNSFGTFGVWENAQAPTQAVTPAGRTEVTVVQTAPRAILTWDKFNVGRETDLRFDQSRGGADARSWAVLNRVDDPSLEPSRILGSMRAEGQVYVVNRNGIIFGGGSRVDVGTLVASAADVGTWGSDTAARNAAFRNGTFVAPAIPVVNGALSVEARRTASFSLDNEALPRLAGSERRNNRGQLIGTTPGVVTEVVVEQGARLTAATEGTVVLAAPRVINRGTVESPRGQVVLAAGAGVFLQQPDASNAADIFRFPAIGLRVEALRRPFYSATELGDTATAYRSDQLDRVASVAINEGVLSAARGNVTVVGNSVVNAAGAIISATTANNRPGSVFLRARDGVGGSPEAGLGVDDTLDPQLFRLGEVSLRPGSLVEIGTEPGADQVVFDGAGSFAQSRLALIGSIVSVGTGATIRAPAATMRIAGDTRTFARNETAENRPDFARRLGGYLTTFVLEPDALVDLGGVKGVQVPVTRNFLTIDVRNNLLANAPLQRNGFLIELSRQRRAVTVDARQGSAILDLAPFVANIPRGIEERQARGGSLEIEAESIFLQQGSRIDLSGGWIDYQGGVRPAETRLIGSDGRLYTFGRAPADVTFVGVAGEHVRTQPRWGFRALYVNPLLAGRGGFERGYVEGFDAGAVILTGRAFLDGIIDGGAIVGSRQASEARANDNDPQSSADLPLGGQFNLASRTPPGGDPVAGVVNPTIVTRIDAPLPIDLDVRLTRVVDPARRSFVDADNVVYPNLNTQVRTTVGPDPLAGRFDTLLPIETVLGRGFSTIDISGQGLFTLSEGTRLDLPAQGGRTASGAVGPARFQVRAWQAQIDGSIVAPGGTIAFDIGTGSRIAASPVPIGSAPVAYFSPDTVPSFGSLEGTLVVGPSAVLSARGRWVNDRVAGDAGAELTGRSFVNGGTIDLATRFSGAVGLTPPAGVDRLALAAIGRDIVVRSGALLDVSGGGYVGPTGTVSGAAAGTLRFQTYTNLSPSLNAAGVGTVVAVSSFYVAGRAARPVVEPGAQLRAYGVGLPGSGVANGAAGRLDIVAPRMVLGRAEAATDAAAGVTAVDLDRYAAVGFGDFRLTGVGGRPNGATSYRGDPGGEIVVLPGVDIAPLPRTLILARNTPALPSGAALEAIGTPALLPQTDRSAVRLWLVANNRLSLGDAATRLYADPGAGRSGADAAIRLAAPRVLYVPGTVEAPAGPVSLELVAPPIAQEDFQDPNSRVLTGTELRRDEQPVLWVASTARLLTRGAAQTTADPRSGLTAGAVRPAGSIGVRSAAALVVEAGALLDVSGVVGATDRVDPNRRVAPPGSRVATVPLYGDAGSIAIEAETAFLNGDLRGGAGGPGGLPGQLSLGSLADTTATDARGIILRTAPSILPPGARPGGLVDPTAIFLSERTGFAPSAFTGRSVFSPGLLTGSGIGRLVLDGALYTQGTVALGVPDQLVVRGPAATTLPPLPPGIVATPAQVTLASAYVVLSNTPNRTAAPRVPDSTLDIDAGFLDVVGNALITGYAQARLTSAGDLRFVGLGGTASVTGRPDDRTVPVASLRTDGDLTLTAAQIYAATDTTAFITAVGAATSATGPRSGVLRIARPAGSAVPEAPLSANSRLILRSDTIEQGGVLRAPSGEVSFVHARNLTLPRDVARRTDTITNLAETAATTPNDAASLRLLPGSVTSVSLDNRLVPFGQTRGGPSPSGFELVPDATAETPGTNTPGLSAPPAKLIAANTANIDVAAGAILDASGGGDLRAFRFVPGSFGLRDVLARVELQPGNQLGAYQFADRRDVFAILPGAQPAAAPFSPLIRDSGTSLGRGEVTANAAASGGPLGATGLDGSWIGDRIALPEGVPGLPAGTYTLLPGRYAILPGAFRVVIPPAGSAPAVQRSLPGAVTAPEGQTFVNAGYIRGLAGAPQGTRVVTVQPEASWRQFATVVTDDASAFFAARAARSETPVPRLPIDAGRLSVAATQTLALAEGVGRFARGPGGRGGLAEISAERIAVTAGGAPYVDPTPVAGLAPFLVLSDRGLSTLGVESLTLGSARSAPVRLEAAGDADRLAESTPARAVRVAAGALLQVPEIVLVAQRQPLPARVQEFDGIRIEAGARIDGSGSLSPGAERNLLVGRSASGVPGSETEIRALPGGDAAILRLASGPQSRVLRANIPTGTAAAGVSLADGAQVTGGALLIDALGPVTIGGGTTFGVASIDLVASAITLGDTTLGDPNGLRLGSAQLSQLAAATDIALRSRNGIGVYGPATIAAAGDVTLDTAAIDAFAGAALSIRAGGTVRLANLLGVPLTAAAGNGQGTLDAEAGTGVALGGGAVALRGFAGTRLATPGALTLRGPVTADTVRRVRAEAPGALSTSGSLQVDAALITAIPGADFELAVGGALALDGALPGATPPLPQAPIGGRFIATADSVRLGTRLALHGGTVELTARGPGGVTLTGGADLDLSGLARQFFDVVRYAPGGLLRVVAEAGPIALAPGARLNVSGAVPLFEALPSSSADAGSIVLTAQVGGGVGIDPAAVLLGTAAPGQRGGMIEVDSEGAIALPAFNRQLDAGGFAGRRKVLTRAGDLTVDPGQVVRAEEISFTADGGVLAVGSGAVLDASGAKGGSIALFARDAVALAPGARLDARGLGAGERGGTVILGTSVGPLRLGGAVIDVSGGQPLYGSLVRWRLPFGTAVLGSDFGASVLGARRLERQIFATTVVTDGLVDQQKVDNAWNALTTALPALGRGNAPAQMVDTPEIEFVGASGLVVPRATPVDGDLPANLAALRYLGEPGVLTLRSPTTLSVLSSISDGFDQPSPTTPVNRWTLRSDRSFSLRLVAGADTDSADPMATRAALTSPLVGDVGSVLVGPAWVGTPSTVRPIAIRTGTGSIEVTAGRDVLIRDPDSVIYTAGRSIVDPSTVVGVDAAGNQTTGVFIPPTPTVIFGTNAPPDYPAAYLEGGGDLAVGARRDVRAAVLDRNGNNAGQIVTAWLWRLGAVADDDRSYLYRGPRGPQVLGTANSCSSPGGLCLAAVGETSTQATWFIRLDQFAQNLGVLGGGDAAVEVGRDFQGSVSIPTTMRTGNGLRDSYVMMNGQVLPTLRGTGSRVRSVDGGGDLVMHVGRDMLAGSQVFIGRGEGDIRVGDDILDQVITSIGTPTSTGLPGATRVGAILALSDAQIRVVAGGSLAVSILDPTERIATGAQRRSEAWSAGGRAAVSQFSSMSADSGVELSALGGKLILLATNDQAVGVAEALEDALRGPGNGTSRNARVLAPTLLPLTNSRVVPSGAQALSPLPLPTTFRATTFAADVEPPTDAAGAPLALRPALNPRSNLQILSSADVRRTSIANLDIGPGRAPTADQPYYPNAFATQRVGTQFIPFIPDRTTYFFATSTSLIVPGAASPSYRASSAPLPRAADAQRHLVYSLGDIVSPRIAPLIGTVGLHAGRDIVDGSSIVIRHNYESDVSFAWADRDLTAGGLLAGPGRLRLIAGRDLIGGARTIGNAVEAPADPASTVVQSAFLPSIGAGIDVLFGIGRSSAGGGFDVRGFLDRYLDPANAGRVFTTYRVVPARTPTGAVVYAVQADAPEPTAPETLARIRGLDQQQQLSLAIDLFFREQNASALEANQRSSPRFNQYTRFYAAKDALLPNQAAYDGTYNLQGNRLRTDRGGDINVIGAGGDFLLGAVSTVADRDPSQRGVLTLNYGNINIYSYGDIQVGQARVITADGGNIFLGSATQDINAGSGARTTRFIAPFTVVYGADLFRRANPAAGITGSGIATLPPNPETLAQERRFGLGVFGWTLLGPAGDAAVLRAPQEERIVAGTAPNINLAAPIGAIDFGDAGVRSAGNLNVAALTVRNAESAQAAGSTTGVPVVQVPNVAVAVAAAAAAGAATQSTTNAAQQSTASQTPAREPPSTISVEVLGFGGTAGEAATLR